MWLDLLEKSGGLVLAFERDGENTPHLAQTLKILTRLDLSLFKELIIPTHHFLSSSIAGHSGPHRQISLLTLGDFWYRRNFALEGGALAAFDTTFPFLDTLCLQGDSRSPTHSSLRSLILDGWGGVTDAHEVRLCLMGLPLLETLVFYDGAGCEGTLGSEAPLTHKGLMRVKVDREGLLEGLKWLSLLSLEVFSLGALTAISLDDIRSANVLQRLLATSKSPCVDLV
jgi:hypothetical protein